MIEIYLMSSSAPVNRFPREHVKCFDGAVLTAVNI